MVRAAALWSAHGAFLLSGVIGTCAGQWSVYHGLGSATSGLAVLPLYIAQLLCVPLALLTRQPLPKGGLLQPRFVALALLDLLGNVLNSLSIIWAGSALWTVVYSSVTLFSAAIKKVVLGKGQSRWQWAALGLTTCGLVLSVVAEDLPHLGPNVAAGVAAGFGGALSFGFMYVLSEVVMTPPQEPAAAPVPLAVAAATGSGGAGANDAAAAPEPLAAAPPLQGAAPPSALWVSGVDGAINTSLLCVYIAFYTLPRWDELVACPIDTALRRGADGADGADASLLIPQRCAAAMDDAALPDPLPSMRMLLLALSIVVVMYLVHMLAFYEMQRASGAVAAGVNKACQSTATFFASAALFCGGAARPAQCLNSAKLASFAVVVLGAVLYAAASRAKGVGKEGAGKERGVVANERVDEGDQVEMTKMVIIKSKV